jgi:hypothetical protein
LARNRPIDLIINRPKLGATVWIELLDPTNSTVKMGFKIWMAVAILNPWVPTLGAIVQCRFQGVELAAWRIEMLVHDDSGYALRGRCASDLRFAGIECESFGGDDPLNEREKTGHPLCENAVARKTEVVGVSLVVDPSLSRQRA